MGETHNYLKELERLRRSGLIRPGQAVDAQVRHDDWCGLLVHGGRCDCAPEIVLTPMPVEEDV